MAPRTSLTAIQLNDSHAYFDLHQEMFWQGDQAVYRPAGSMPALPVSSSRFGLNARVRSCFAIAAILSMAPIPS